MTGPEPAVRKYYAVSESLHSALWERELGSKEQSQHIADTLSRNHKKRFRVYEVTVIATCISDEEKP